MFDPTEKEIRAMRRADTIFYSVMLTLLAVFFLVFGFSPWAKECHARGGQLSLTFECNKITITPV